MLCVPTASIVEHSNTLTTDLLSDASLCLFVNQTAVSPIPKEPLKTYLPPMTYRELEEQLRLLPEDQKDKPVIFQTWDQMLSKEWEVKTVKTVAVLRSKERQRTLLST